MKRIPMAFVFMFILMILSLSIYADTPSGLRIVLPASEEDGEGDDDDTYSYPPEVRYDFPLLPLTSSGWTDFEDLLTNEGYQTARVVFVSNDGNDNTAQIYGISKVTFDSNGMFQPVGTVQPFATITAAYANMRGGYPDILLLNRGDEWTESFDTDGIGRVKSGSSFNERHIIASYGTGVRPQLFESIINARNASYIIISGLRLYTDDWRTADRAIDITGEVYHQLYEDIKVDQHYKNLIQGGTHTLENIALRRCIFTDHSAHDGVFYTAGVNGLLFEENVFFRPREPSSDSRYGRHLYLSPSGEEKHGLTGLILRRNIFNQGERESIDVRAGGLIENNLSLQNDLLTVGGRGGSENSIQTAHIINNVFMQGSPLTNGENELNLINIYNGIVSGNIWTDNTNLGSSVNVINIVGSDTVRVALHIDISNNTIYGFSGDGSARGFTISSDLIDVEDITVQGNEFQYVNGSSQIILHREWQEDLFEGFTYSNNKYFSTAAVGDWFSPGGTFAEWVVLSGETGGEAVQISYTDANRTITTYNSYIGEPGTTEDFMLKVLDQSRYNWNPDYTADAVNDYIREGFDK